MIQKQAFLHNEYLKNILMLILSYSSLCKMSYLFFVFVQCGITTSSASDDTWVISTTRRRPRVTDTVSVFIQYVCPPYVLKHLMLYIVSKQH